MALVGLTVFGGLVTQVSALAINQSSTQNRWPGVLDVVRRSPFLAAGVLTCLVLVGAGLLVWVQERPWARRHDPPPPSVEPTPAWVVSRRAEVDEIVRVLTDRDRKTVGITTALEGAGGFGKSTVASLVCANRRIRRRFKSRIYPLTIGRDIHGRDAIATKVNELVALITGRESGFSDPESAGRHLGRILDERPPVLIVLDDVWTDIQLTPFLFGGGRCARLITTRVPSALPGSAARVEVDRMTATEARAVLLWADDRLERNLTGMDPQLTQIVHD